MITRIRAAALGAVLALGTMLAAAPAGHALLPTALIAATGTDGSADVTLKFTGNVSQTDATLITVYPGLVVRTPPFYPVGAVGLSEGCQLVSVPLGTGTGSANPGLSFASSAAYDATTDTTTIVVTVQNVLAAGHWAVVVSSGAVTPNPASPGCVHFVATP